VSANGSKPSRRASRGSKVEHLQLPPHSIEAEQALLGALMLDNEAFDKVSPPIGVSSFFRRDSQLIFGAIEDLQARGDAFDAVTVAGLLEDRGQIDEVGGLKYVATIANETPTAANILSYAKKVSEKACLRELIAICDYAARSATDARAPAELLADVEDRLRQLKLASAAESQSIKLLAFDLDAMLVPIPPERNLIAGIPREAYTLIAGALSSYKSTLMLYLMILRATGYDFLNLDKTMIASDIGAAVLIFYEDTDKRVRGKFHAIIQSGYAQIKAVHGERTAQDFLERAAKNIRRIAFTGCFRKTIVARIAGTVIPNEPMIEELLARVREFASTDVLIGIDPLRLAIVGSQNDDDGADVVVHTLNRLSVEIPDSGLVVASHTTKSGAQDPAADYTGKSYATSGSALYSQHARSNFHMSRIKPDEIGKLFEPIDVPASEYERQPVARLSHGRLSHGSESREVYIRMDKGILVPLKTRELRSAAQIGDQHLPIVVMVMEDILAKHRRASETALCADERLQKIGNKHKIREILGLLEGDGYIEFSGKTKNREGIVTPKGRAAVGTNPDESKGNRS
jgi:hypothetical protein